MNYLVAALAGASLGSAPAVPPPQQPPALRQVVEAYRPGVVPPPRELSPDQRVQLRRELSQFGRPPARR